MRDIEEVVDEILSAVPERDAFFRHELEATKLAVATALPSAIPGWWLELEAVIDRNIEFPDEQWEQDVLDILAGTDESVGVLPERRGEAVSTPEAADGLPKKQGGPINKLRMMWRNLTLRLHMGKNCIHYGRFRCSGIDVYADGMPFPDATVVECRDWSDGTRSHDLRVSGDWAEMEKAWKAWEAKNSFKDENYNLYAESYKYVGACQEEVPYG